MEIKCSFVGDVLIADSYYDLGFGIIEKLQKDKKGVFLKPISEYFSTSDYVIGNFEFVMSDQTERQGLRKREFILSPAFVDIVKDLGIHMYNLANNHIMQHDKLGFDNTVKTLESNNIKVFGTKKKPYQILTKNGYKIGILGASTIFDPFVDNPEDYYLNLYPRHLIHESDYQNISSLLTKEEKMFLDSCYVKKNAFYTLNVNLVRNHSDIEIKLMSIFMRKKVCNRITGFFDLLNTLKRKCNYVFVYLHWGDEFISYPATWQRKMAQELIDCGADSVIGCHSHCLQGMEQYCNHNIIYSLGNFLFHTIDPNLSETVILDATLSECSREKDVFSLRPFVFHPYKMIPVPGDGQILKKIEGYSKKIMNGTNYIQDYKEALALARSYKKKHLLKNIHRMDKRVLLIMFVEFLKRRLKSKKET